MKFTVSSSTLYKQLSQISGVISNNPIVPILENFLFQLEDNHLTVSASDLQISMTTSLSVEGDNSGSIAIPAKILLDTLKNLPEQPVHFNILEESFMVEIHSSNGNYKLAGENATDFPHLPESDNGFTFDIPTGKLQKAINNTIFAASSDELRPAMTGILVELKHDRTNFVSTDGNRLVQFTLDNVLSPEENAMIIPRKAFNLLRSVIPNDEIPARIAYNSANIFISFNNIHLACRLIDERFPDYENAIPKENPNLLNIERTTFLNSLRRISIYANKTTQQIRMNINADSLQLSAEDLDFSNEAVENLDCEYLGEPLEIGFNAKFLIEMLSNMDSEHVKMELSEANKAGILLPVEQEENEHVLMLVMPVMLSNYV